MDIINEYEEIALSNFDVLKLVKGKANLVLYPQLQKYNNLDQLLGTYEACFLLFESKPKYGHWCCIFKLDNDTIEFFNPYGGYPDESLKYIPKKFRIISNQNYPYLSQLLLNSPYELTYNEYSFQKKKQKINTCGRWCALRIHLRHLTLKQFKKYINNVCKKLDLDYDQAVTLLTMWIN